MKISSVRFGGLAVLPFVWLLLGGCQSTADRHALEEARHSVPPMAAHETFFDGRIAAQLTLGTGLPDDAAPGGGKDGSGGGKGPGGGGMRSGRRGGGNPGGGDTGGSDEPSVHLVDSPMPPALLRLRLVNRSASPITVEIRDLNSELGNFAVRPDTFTLAPGATGEPNGMESLLGLDTFELPVTLTLHAGDKIETKVLTLRPVAPPPAPPPSR